MPRRPTNEIIESNYFRWLIYLRNEMYYADGRSKTLNGVNLGRHSLAIRDRSDLLRVLSQLDLSIARSRGIHIPETDSTDFGRLTIENGLSMFLESSNKPRLLKGNAENTRKKYSSEARVITAHFRKEHIRHWDQVNTQLVVDFATKRSQSRSESTVYFDVNFCKQVVKWLIEQNRLPTSASIRIPMRKPNYKRRHCYSQPQIQAILDYCSSPKLEWLRNLSMGLMFMGLRIKELTALRWKNIDFEHGMIRLFHESNAEPDGSNPQSMQTKNQLNRELPIHKDLLPFLLRLKASSKGELVFTSRYRKHINADSARRILKKVLRSIATKNIDQPWSKDIELGVFHSFRHYFVTACVNSNVPIMMLKHWVGHRHSVMIERYYHLKENEARLHMDRVDFGIQLEPAQLHSAPAHEPGKTIQLEEVGLEPEASIRPRLMSRGKRSSRGAMLERCLSFNSAPAHEPGKTTKQCHLLSLQLASFNSAPAHEPGKTQRLTQGNVGDDGFNSAPAHEPGKTTP